MNLLLKKLERKEPVFGFFCSLPSPAIIEFCGMNQYDFILIDLEHSLISFEQLNNMILAARSVHIPCWIRIPPNEKSWIVKALDAGANGIVFPKVQSAEQAKELASHCFYPPRGNRGLNVSRHMNYGINQNLVEAMENHQSSLLVIAMIEDQQGAKSANDIAQVTDIHMLMEGAADLSADMNLTWQTRHPSVVSTILDIHDAAKTNNKLFCAFPREKTDYSSWQQRGVSCFIIGNDVGLIRRSLKQEIMNARNSLNSISE